MNDYSTKLKNELEAFFSMPFDVSSTFKDGEIHYTCCPSNEDNMYFVIEVFVHNHIRLIIEMYPQKHGGYILNEMSQADLAKRTKFQLVASMLRDKGAKIDFLVNGTKLKDVEIWPTVWRNFSAKFVLLPLPDVSDEDGEYKVFTEWTKYAFEYLFSLLTIDDLDKENLSVLTEGTPSEIKAIRYERNPTNRQLCLYRQGYTCAVCGFNFQEVYGDIGSHFIEVHHKMPVSMMTSDYQFDVDRDLVPLCSNCHSMAHRRNPPYTIEELKEFVNKQLNKEATKDKSV